MFTILRSASSIWFILIHSFWRFFEFFHAILVCCNKNNQKGILGLAYCWIDMDWHGLTMLQRIQMHWPHLRCSGSRCPHRCWWQESRQNRHYPSRLTNLSDCFGPVPSCFTCSPQNSVEKWVERSWKKLKHLKAHRSSHRWTPHCASQNRTVAKLCRNRLARYRCPRTHSPRFAGPGSASGRSKLGQMCNQQSTRDPKTDCQIGPPSTSCTLSSSADPWFKCKENIWIHRWIMLDQQRTTDIFWENKNAKD